MLSRFHRKIGSILGLLAILMVTLAPTVSQALAASRGESTVSSAHCSMPSMRDHVPDIRSAPYSLMSDGQACCYCGLLAHMYLRPIAVTGEAGPALTTGAGQPNAFNYGVTVQYSLPYLQQHVHDIGLPRPLANTIPLVEIPLSRSQGQTTGTVNPGFIWINRYGQFGIEAQIPINRASGSRVGILVQAHIFFDDVAPTTIGKPLFQ